MIAIEAAVHCVVGETGRHTDETHRCRNVERLTDYMIGVSNNSGVTVHTVDKKQ